MNHWIKLIIISSVLAACSNKSEVRTAELFAAKTTVNIGDSVQLNTQNFELSYAWSITPNIGSVNNTYYLAPNTLYNDSTLVTIKAFNKKQVASIQLLIIRGEKSDSSLSFKNHIQPILKSNCNFSACHGNGSSAGKVNLENYDAVMTTVSPFQPKKSLLFLSLIKPDPLRRMPPAGPLQTNKLNAISNWIEQGAYNN
jgi:hypothetical protein